MAARNKGLSPLPSPGREGKKLSDGRGRPVASDQEGRKMGNSSAAHHWPVTSQLIWLCDHTWQSIPRQPRLPPLCYHSPSFRTGIPESGLWP